MPSSVAVDSRPRLPAPAARSTREHLRQRERIREEWAAQAPACRVRGNGRLTIRKVYQDAGNGPASRDVQRLDPNSFDVYSGLDKLRLAVVEQLRVIRLTFPA